jgi:hypothetical protein
VHQQLLLNHMASLASAAALHQDEEEEDVGLNLVDAEV